VGYLISRADVADDVLYRGVLGELDVVDDCAVAGPDQPFGCGGDLGVVGGEDDGHVVFGAQAGEQVEDAGGVGGVEVAGGLTRPLVLTHFKHGYIT
jgi:hypothetical protein